MMSELVLIDPTALRPHEKVDVELALLPNDVDPAKLVELAQETE